MTSSPYRFIGTSKAGNLVTRTDLIFLDTLSRCDSYVTTEALGELADPRGIMKFGSAEIIVHLVSMLADGYVENNSDHAAPLRWWITEKGKAHLIAAEAQDIFNECARYTPVCRKPLRIEEAPEPIRRTPAGAELHERLKASNALHDTDEARPATAAVCNATVPRTALLCLDEDELDAWWHSLDVEQKADAFAGFALHQHDVVESHVYVEPTHRVPFRGGSAGESPEEWATLVDRYTTAPKAEAVR